MNFYRVVTNEKVRFESLRLEDCEDYAKKIYRSEGEIPEIYEVTARQR